MGQKLTRRKMLRGAIAVAGGATAAGMLPAGSAAASGSVATGSRGVATAAQANVEHPGYVVDGLDASSYLRLPAAARMPEYPAKGYLLDNLGGGAYGVRTAGGSNSMFLVTGEGVVVVDAPNGALVKAAIAEVTKLPVTHFIYSHSHGDHTGGAATFLTSNRKGTSPVYIAHEQAAARIKRAADPRRPVPTKTVRGDRYVLRTGGERIYLDYHGNFHSPGDLFVFAPRQKVLMLVDVIAPRYAPYFQLGHTPDIPLYMTVSDVVLRYDFRTFIGGHAHHYGTRQDIATYGKYLDDLYNTARKVFLEGRVDFSQLEPGNAWGGSQLFYGTLARQTAEQMPKHWLTELAGADLYVEGSARVLLYSFWTDYAPFPGGPNDPNR
ncbi:MBL fold metallo-hydrolase [Streptomyces sp. S3(2020)]|uniref:MBL fold metallo-hydrolase n=1 Tax=Streptomyces sp. S3(2020) TaxID=2732044 RepID=UPI0014890864|nr:MBL fold metallo-hydrolase [Streptomyces sp. S3(2020)]NNN30620.1 MBL fold metallo-hydrolase [Streptomyces sp. S3(2020)]